MTSRCFPASCYLQVIVDNLRGDCEVCFCSHCWVALQTCVVFSPVLAKWHMMRRVGRYAFTYSLTNFSPACCQCFVLYFDSFSLQLGVRSVHCVGRGLTCRLKCVESDVKPLLAHYFIIAMHLESLS